jgi:hypothetical protein
MARAVLQKNGRYLAHQPEPVGKLGDLLQRLLQAVGSDDSAFLGFDFPIGLPVRYAKRAGIEDFLAVLPQLGQGAWASFYEVAERSDQISLRRPFYPKRPGGTKQRHLLDGLGMALVNDLRRRCERARPDRRAAAPLFWTLGAQQVGKAAIIGWRDVLGPGLRNTALNLSIWPFAGLLFELFQPASVLVAETYPTEFYTHLKVKFPRSRAGRRSGKRVQADRAANAEVLEVWADRVGVALSIVLRAALREGFGDSGDGEDRFDAVIGLFGMLNVALGHRLPGEPEHDDIRKVEGWILGQEWEGNHSSSSALQSYK